MNKILTLNQIADAQGIRIKYENLRNTHPQLEGYARPIRKLIVLEESLKSDPRKEQCILSEEIGHCIYPPTTSHVVYHIAEYYDMNHWERDRLALSVSRDERTALGWATSFIIPDAEFWEFAKSPHEWWEWLEHFYVEDWFMRAKIGFMRLKQPFKWRQVIKRI